MPHEVFQFTYWLASKALGKIRCFPGVL